MSAKTTSECPSCEIKPLVRNNYFTGKLLVERDFKDEQRYYIDKLRLHQKRLHGEGVVCGLEVVQHANPACRDKYVCIQPGFAKDCCGNDILVPAEECIDITQFKSWKKLQAGQNTQSSGAGGIAAAHTLQICLRYRECPTENIPVLYDDCGCDDTACAPNRILESYAFDLLVDPAIKPKQGCMPGLTAGSALAALNSAGGAVNVTDLVYDSAGHLYALDSGASPALYQLDTAGLNIIASHNLGPGVGKSVAVSDDAKAVYVVSYNQAANQSTLLALNAAGLAVTGTSAPVADSGGPIDIAFLPQSRVAWLQAGAPQFLVWDVSGATPQQTSALALTGKPGGLALGADRTHAYYVDSAAKQIGAIDIATPKSLPPLAQVANPTQVLVANTSGSDILAVLDRADSTIAALQTNPPGEVASIVLLNTPLSGAADPEKKVLYLVTETAASTFQLQAFDLRKLVAGSPELPPDGIAIGTPASPPAIATNGRIVFVATAGQATGTTVVQGFQSSPSVCPDLYELEDCHDCCEPDCLVLATIRGYQPGFAIDDPASPSSDPLQDYANQIARIDNRLDRTILPSTRRIAEVLESVVCGCACGCGTEVINTTTTTTTTNPVAGLNPNLPKIIDIGWSHGANVVWNDFVKAEQFAVPPTAASIAKHLPMLTIYFNQQMSGIDRQTFRVEIAYPQAGPSASGAVTFNGLYNTSRVRLYGILVDLVPFGVAITPHTSEVAASAWAFIPYFEVWKTLIALRMWDGQSYLNQNWPALDPPYVRVALSGDFIYAGTVYSESNMLDGDNIGGQVGNATYLRPGPITGGKNPSGDMLEGGTFESWFALVQPSNAGTPGNLAINEASAADLQALPGVGAALAKNIVAERKKAPFTNMADLQKRVGLSADAAEALTNLIAF